MYPSEKTRKFGLMTTGTRGMKLIKYGFGVLGTSIFLIASLVSLIAMIFGKEENHTVSFVLFLVFLAAALLYAAIGFLIFPAVSKKLDDGKNAFVMPPRTTLSAGASQSLGPGLPLPADTAPAQPLYPAG